ncbi:MAG: minor capsid protein [Eubacterium sp.]|nr:minor capsid protein [Eubacterium sp.]
MNSRDYWERRAAQDMYDRMGSAEETAAEMNAAIKQTSAYLEKEVKAVMRGMQSFGISEAEAKKILNAAGDGTVLQRLRKAAQQVGDPEKREALLNAINSAGAYRYRITRIEELNRDINRQCRELYKTENRHITSALRNVAEDSYYHEIFSIQKGTGLGFSFSKFPRQDVDRILRSNWSGGNYSQRIWKDVSGMTARLKNELLVSMLSGRSSEKTARIFQEQFGVNAFCARRIVRTESAYVANAAQAKAYGEAGIERYRFVATLDSRTCECCAALDGRAFELAKKKPGTNYPPMHPFCRSTTIADFGDEELAGLERRAKDKDGNTVKVPADMSYEEWRREFVDNKSTSENMKGPAPEIGKRKDPCANGHYFIDKSETPPTCTEDGKREKVCAVCGKTEVETVPATGHRYVDTIVQPTCTEKGYTLHKCSVCGDSYQDAETQPLGHNYEAVKTVQPTCVDKGFTEYCCTRCGDTYTDDIPATGHKFGKYKIVTKPTSVSEGLKARCAARAMK